jgi:hypothetical protein
MDSKSIKCGFESHSGHTPVMSEPDASIGVMYDQQTRYRAMALVARGHSLRQVSLATGIAHATLRDWRDHPDKLASQRTTTCARCSDTPVTPGPRRSYAYLLGLYLGDGCINRQGPESKGVWKLRITCAASWPGLLEECRHAMLAVRPVTAGRPASSITKIQRAGCFELVSYSKHWPCLFPQHGPGPKHHREIKLEPWQQEIVISHPGDFARGLFHSDGCRLVNRVRRRLPGGDRWYEYPRYLFVNMSPDIHRLCGEALDRLDVAWRFSKPTTISVARREAVARLDEFVGPKY